MEKNPDQTSAANESTDSMDALPPRADAPPPRADNDARSEDESAMEEHQLQRRPPSPVTYEDVDRAPLLLSAHRVITEGFSSVVVAEDRVAGGADPAPGAVGPAADGAAANRPPAVDGAAANGPPAVNGAAANRPPAVDGAAADRPPAVDGAAANRPPAAAPVPGRPLAFGQPNYPEEPVIPHREEPAAAERVPNMPDIPPFRRYQAPAPVVPREPRPVPEREIQQFNADDGPLKHLLDIILGQAIHNPTAAVVRQALNSLLELLFVTANGRSLRRNPVELLRQHAIIPAMRFATLRHVAEELVNARPNNPEAIAARRNLKRFYLDLARIIRRLLTLIRNLHDDDNLIVIRTGFGEDAVQEPLDLVYTDLACLMDTSYHRRLVNRVTTAVFLDQPIELGDRYPDVGSLLNRAPRSEDFENKPPSPYTHNLNLVSVPHPVTIAERNSWNRDLVNVDPTARNCPLFRAGTVHELYNFCKKNPGCFFELRGQTGSGKTLLANMLAGLGTVLIAMDNDFHVELMYDFMCNSGYRVEVRTERYAKYGHLPHNHREKIFVRQHPGDMIEPAINRERLYQPMRSYPAVEVYLCTYETLRQLIKIRDFPDILILDDVRSKNKHKDLALFMLRNSTDLPRDMIIGGMCAGPLDNARFTFNTVMENPSRPRDRHPFMLFDSDAGRPYQVVQIPPAAAFFMSETGVLVVRRLVDEPAAVRDLLLHAQRPDLLPFLQDLANQTAFQDYKRNYGFMGQEQFAEWVNLSFFPSLANAGHLLNDLLDIVADSVPRNRNQLPPGEHTRLLSGPQIDDAIRFYESKCTTMNSGNCLVFLPSIEAVLSVNRYLRTVAAARRIEIVPIVGPHSVDEIELTKHLLNEDENGRIKGRVVLLSPEAEASVTISYVSYIIDSGLKHQVLVDNESGVEYSLTLAANQQERAQRIGRGGRTAPTVYVALPLNGDPDMVPEILNERGSDRVEIRTLIMELLMLNAYMGDDVERNIILARLTTWFPDINMSLLDATLALMETDGICALNGEEVFLTGLGFLVSSFPGTYDECFLVAVGSLFGCFRSITSYVVCRKALDDFWVEQDERSRRWREFFARGEPVRGDSHMDFIMATMYWYLKNENDSLACLRANTTPARFVELKFAIRRYEVAMFAFGCVREQGNQTLSWNYCKNDESIFARRMALFAGSHGNLALYDDRHHVMPLSTGHTVQRPDHPQPVPDRCPMFPAKGICAFTKLRASIGDTPDEVFGVTCGGFLIPLLSIDVTQPNLVDLRSEDGSLVLRTHLYADGDNIEDIVQVRRVISKLVKAWLAGTWNALDGLTNYIGRISQFCQRRRLEIPDFERWDQRMFTPGNPFPPAGLSRRRRWCSRCLHQGHIFEECLSGIFEARFRHSMCHIVLFDADLDTPVRWRSEDVQANNFRITYDARGEARCCHTCFNLFHRYTECRSAARADGCIRCAHLGHTHTECDNPHVCNNCGLRIHVEHRCAEDRLLLQQVFHMSVSTFIRRVLMPKIANAEELWTARQLATIRPPAVVSPYFLLPRIGGNTNANDPAGAEREIFEDIKKSLI